LAAAAAETKKKKKKQRRKKKAAKKELGTDDEGNQEQLALLRGEVAHAEGEDAAFCSDQEREDDAYVNGFRERLQQFSRQMTES